MFLEFYKIKKLKLFKLKQITKNAGSEATKLEAIASKKWNVIWLKSVIFFNEITLTLLLEPILLKVPTTFTHSPSLNNSR